MSCCGEKIKTVADAGRTVTAAIRGNAGYLFERVFGLAVGGSPDTDRRTRICQQCEKSTWLTKKEYIGFVANNLTGVAANLDDLSRLPELPKETNGKGRNLFCMICKCFVPAKARLQEEHCPLVKW